MRKCVSLVLALMVVVIVVALVPSVAGQRRGSLPLDDRVNRRSQTAPAIAVPSVPQQNGPIPIPQQNGPIPVPQVQFPASQPRQQTPFMYNPASAAVTELARAVGRILGVKNKAAVFSPVSIASALSLMLIGANHETKNELIQVLGFQRYTNNLDIIHQLYSDMLNDLAKTEFGTTPPQWRTFNPCYDDEEEDEEDGYPAPTKDVIRVTNAVFVREGLQLSDNFRYSSGRYYNSTAANVPFATDPARAAQLINAWAHRSTEGKIRNILSEQVAAEAEMIVASALYFKGLWSEPFEYQATEMKPFFPDGYDRPGKTVLSMVTVGCFPYYDATEYDAKIVGLSYQGNKSALYIIMPNNSTRPRMLNFQSQLTPAMIGDMVVKMTMRKMYLQLPKMQITNTINLRDVLQQLGLRTLFDRGQSDLSGMIAKPTQVDLFATRFGDKPDPSSFVFPVDNDPEPTDNRRGGYSPPTSPVAGHEATNSPRVPGPQLHVSEFIHRVELDINEKGTEGGAITTSTVFRALPSIHLRIDAPFLLLLGHDDTRLPLFYGSIFDPTP